MGITAEMAAPPALGNVALAVSENHKLDQPPQSKSVAGGCLSLVVLGASGDLAKKKTFPAIFNLYKQGFLPNELQIFGYARSKLSDEELRKKIRGYLKTDRTDLNPEDLIN